MSRYRRPDGPPKARVNFYLENKNVQLLKQMCGKMSYSWFIDELIAREHRRREKRVTQPAHDSALT